MAAGPVFPGFIRVEYKTDGSSKSKFLAEAAQLSGEIKKPFSEAFDQIGKMVDRVSGKLKDGNFSLDLDTSSLRAASAQADFTAKKLGALRDAALQIATANKDQSESTLAFTKALQAQAAEAERVSQTARDQLTAYTNLQGAVSSLTRENQVLAQSYRDTFLEQAKVANAAYKAQQQFNALSAPGIDRPAKSARDSASVFASQSYAPKADLRSGLDRLLDGQASLDRAAVSGVKLEQVLGRVSVKGKEVAAALKEAAAAADKAANVETGPRRANPGPTNTRSGADALVAGQASLDRAAISGATLEQVLGRVANKGREVGAALADAERAAAKATQERVAAQAKAEAEAADAKAKAAAELQRLGQAAEALNARLNPAVGIQQRYNAEIEHARTLLKAGVIDQNLYGQAVARAASDQAAALKLLSASQEASNQSAKRGTDETRNVINSMRAARVAGIQAGQQLQDMAIQFQMGTNASTILAQQLPQLGFALSGLEDNANKTLSRFGKFGAFLAGPWGAAILIAGVALGPLIEKLLGAGDAADEAKGKTYDFANGLNVLSLSASNAADAMAQLSNEMRNAIAVQGDFLAGKANVAKQSLAQLQALYDAEDKELRGLQARAKSLNPFDRLSAQEVYRMGALAQNRKPLQDALNSARAADVAAKEALAQQRGLEMADPRSAATGRYNRAVADLRSRFQQSQSDPVGASSAGRYITEAQYQSEFARLTAAKDKEIDSLRKTRTPKGADPAKEAERAARAAQRLGEFGEDAGKKIANIRDSFADIPPEVERVNKASRELDDIISDLMNRKPEGFAELVDQAKALKDALPDMAFQRVMREITADAQQQVQYQMLLLQGRDGEAQALQHIYQIEQNLGPLRKDQKEQIIATGIAMQRINEQMQRASEIQGVFLDATRNVRSEVEAILGGYGSLNNLGATLRRSFQQIQGKILSEKIFGDVFRDMDRYVKEKTGIGSSVDMLKKETERAGAAAVDFAEAIDAATMRIMGGGSGAAGIVAGATAATAWGNIRIPDSIRNPNYDGDPNGPITVKGQAPKSTKPTLVNMTPEEYFRKMGQDVGAKWAAQLQPLLGKKLAGTLGGVLGGVLEGQATTGTGFGAILGGLKELKGLPKGLSGALGKAFGGAQTGAAVAGIGNALGIKMSNTGAQIGAAIGSLLPIPGGAIAGAVAGGLFKKLGSMGLLGPLGIIATRVKKGYAVASNGTVTTGGNRTQADNAKQGINSVNDSLSNIARVFGTTLGNYAVSIGSRSSGYIRVSASGSTRVGDKSFAKNGGSDLLYDGKDMQEALRIALKNAIEDGAIQGIRAGSKRLLSIGSNIDAQVEKALKFEKVFKDLKQIKDPIGFALDELNNEFKSLIDTFKEAGASAEEMAQLEELYGIKRKDAIKQASEAMLGPIKSLLDSLNIGSDFYSLRDRQASAQAVYNPLAERVKAGDMTAYAEFSDAAQTLININRELYGSSSQFFDFVDQVKAISQGAVNREQAKIDAATASDSPFKQLATQQQATTSAIDSQTQALLAALGGMNENLAAMVRAMVARTGQNNDSVQLAGFLGGRGFF